MSIRIGSDLYDIAGLSGKSAVRQSSRASSSANTNNVSGNFASELSSSLAALSATGNNSFFNSLSSLYSGLNYNSFDASNLSQNYWGRNDFPLENLFTGNNAGSVLNWIPQGSEPAANSLSVMNRLTNTLGMKAIVIAPELEAKFNSNPQLAQNVMDKISGYIKGTDELFSGSRKSDALILDGNGDISHYRTFVENKGLIQPEELEEVKEKASRNIRVMDTTRYFM